MDDIDRMARQVLRPLHRRLVAIWVGVGVAFVVLAALTGNFRPDNGDRCLETTQAGDCIRWMAQDGSRHSSVGETGLLVALWVAMALLLGFVYWWQKQGAVRYVLNAPED